MKHKKDRITGGVLAAVAAAYIAASYSIKVFEGAGKTVINAGTIPRMWGVCLLILSLVLLFRKGEASDMQERKEEDVGVQNMSLQRRMTVKERLHESYAVAGTFLLMAVYIFLIDKVGYLLDTWIYLILQIFLLSPAGKKNWMAVIAVSTLVSAGTCYIFTHWLGVPLPPGILTL